MTIYNPNTKSAYRALNSGLTANKEFIYSVFTFPDNNIQLTDVIEMFAVGTLHNITVTGWEVFLEQVDLGTTVSFNIGCGDASGISGTDGYRWASNTTDLGRAGLGNSMTRHANGNHWRRNGGDQLVGIQPTALPTAGNAAWTGKRIIMALRIVPTFLW